MSAIKQMIRNLFCGKKKQNEPQRKEIILKRQADNDRVIVLRRKNKEL